MATGDLWQVRVKGTYISVPVNNIYWYEETGNTTINTASRIAEYFDGTILTGIAAIQHAQMVYSNIIVTNWTTGEEQVDRPTTVVGHATLLSDPMPSYVTFSYKFPKSVPKYSSGGKRLAGVSEIYVNGNTETISAQDLIDVRTALMASINYQGVFARPVVLVRQIDGVPQNTEMGDAPFITWAITDAIFRGVSTQRTRLRLNP